MIEISQPNMILLLDGIELSRHRSAVEAMEAAGQHGPGRYVLVRPAATISVSGEVVEPPPPETEPEPAPEPVPPSDPAPIPGSIADAIRDGLLPRYRNLGYEVEPDLDTNWTSMAGERGEIGYVPEQHAAYLAGQSDLEASILEAASQPLPDSIAYSHMPNLHWLPFLLTGDRAFVEKMEFIQAGAMAYRRRSPGSSLGTKIFGRELAWVLRNLAQLAWLQEQGHTTATWYADTLEATRLDFVDRMSDPLHDRWRVLNFNTVYWASYGWTGWMEAFLGMVLGRMVSMGFEDWRPIAEWHFGGLQKRVEHWGIKGASVSHFSFKGHAEHQGVDMTGWNWPEIKTYAETLGWDQALPYGPEKSLHPDYLAHPADDVVFLMRLDGTRYSYSNREHGLFQWAASVDTPEARELAQRLYDAIERRGDSWDYRHAFALPESNDDFVVPGWRKSMAPRTWTEIPTTNRLSDINPANDPAINPNYPRDPEWYAQGGFSRVMSAWCGAAFNQRDCVLGIPLAGGHADYAGNEPYDICLADENPTWRMLRPPTGALPDAILTNDGNDGAGHNSRYADGRIRSTHTYSTLVHVPGIGWGITMIGAPSWSGTNPRGNPVLIDEHSGEMIRLGADNNVISTGNGCYDPVRHCFWVQETGGFRIERYDIATDTWDAGPNFSVASKRVQLCYLDGEDLIFVRRGSGTWAIFDPATRTLTTINSTGSGILDASAEDAQPAWCEYDRSIYLWDNATDTDKLTRITPGADLKTDTWTVSTVTPDAGNRVIPTPKTGRGTYGRFGYSKRLDGFYLINRVDEPIYFFARS